MEIKKIKLSEYEKLPVFYDSDGGFDKDAPLPEIGDYFLMSEPEECKERKDIVSVYEVIAVKERGWESKITVLEID